MDDLSLEDLQAALQSAQEQKSATRLSERNVVELVNKLQELGLLGSDLLHSINGREYITHDRLCQEVKQAVSQAGGRIAVVDLPAQLGVDLVHCNAQAARAVEESNGGMQVVQGELITQAYFDSIAAEIDELLQEAGVVALSDLAMRFKLGSELLLSSINARLNTAIHGRLEAGILYTSAYISRIKAQLCGALRGASSPVNLGSLIKELDLQATSSASKTVSALVEELSAEGAINGTLKGGTGTWTPAIFAHAQQAAASSFYSQNDFIGYDMLEKMGIVDGRSFMTASFPNGLPLESAYVSPHIGNRLEAAVEDAVSSNSWVDALSVLPSSLTSADTAALLQRVPAIQVAGTDVALLMLHGAGKNRQGGPTIVAGSCVVSAALLQSLQQRSLEEARAAAEAALKQRRSSAATASTSTAETPQAASTAAKKSDPKGDDSDDDWDSGKGGNKKKKAGKRKGGGPKGKSAPAGNATGKGAKGKSGLSEADSEAAILLSVEALCSRLEEWLPDAAGSGEDGTFLEGLAADLRPAAVAEYERTLAAVFSAGAEARRRKRDAIAKALEETYLQLQLYAHGVQLAAADEATYTALQRHLLRSVGMQVMDCILRYQTDILKYSRGFTNQTQQKSWQHAVDTVEEQPSEEKEGGPAGAWAPLAPADRAAILKSLPPDTMHTFVAANEALGSADSQGAQAALEAAAEAAGLQLRKLDKKAEKALLAEHRRGLEQQLEAEFSPATALSLAVPLLVAKVHDRAMSIPGRALAGVISLLKGEMPAPAHKHLLEFHSKVVSILRGQSEGDDDLQGMLPGIKAAAGLNVESPEALHDNEDESVASDIR